MKRQTQSLIVFKWKKSFEQVLTLLLIA